MQRFWLVYASVDGGGDWDLCFVYDVDIHATVLVSSQVVRSVTTEANRIYG